MAIKRGEKKLSARQQAAQVRAWTGWSKKQYQREYDKLRNRVRNYERVNGYEQGTYNVADLLARNARNKYYAPRYGETPKDTNLYAAIQRTTSASTGAKLSQSAQEKATAAAFAAIDKQYAGAIAKSAWVNQAIEDLKKSNPNYTPQQYEKVIKTTIEQSVKYGQIAKKYREERAKEGYIEPYEPESP